METIDDWTSNKSRQFYLQSQQKLPIRTKPNPTFFPNKKRSVGEHKGNLEIRYLCTTLPDGNTPTPKTTTRMGIRFEILMESDPQEILFNHPIHKTETPESTKPQRNDFSFFAV